jgi:hypothetical protein
MLDNTEDVAEHTPASVKKGAEWAVIVNAKEEKGVNYFKALHRKIF